jgi:hypothetical protein
LTSWLPKVRLAGVSETAGVVPVPLSTTLCGLPMALSVIEIVPERLPVPAGVKVTLMVQVDPAARELAPLGQVFV